MNKQSTSEQKAIEQKNALDFLEEVLKYLYDNPKVICDLLDSFTSKSKEPDLVYFEDADKEPYVSYLYKDIEYSDLKSEKKWNRIYANSFRELILRIELRINFPKPKTTLDFTNGLPIKNYYFVIQHAEWDYFIAYRDIESLRSDFYNRRIITSNLKRLD